MYISGIRYRREELHRKGKPDGYRKGRNIAPRRGRGSWDHGAWFHGTVVGWVSCHRMAELCAASCIMYGELRGMRCMRCCEGRREADWKGNGNREGCLGTMWRGAFDSKADVASETRLVPCIFILNMIHEKGVQERAGGNKRFLRSSATRDWQFDYFRIFFFINFISWSVYNRVL